MDRDERLGVWVPLGALGAVALGVVLIPLRTVTSASNLSLVFLAFTIVVAELGGRIPALVTALMAAISLNFFLTEPYLSLTIDKPDDLVAFVALAGCGLIAAAFGTRRERLSETAKRAAQELEVLRRLVAQVRTGADLTEVLSGLRSAFGFRSMALRDDAERVIASVGEVPRTTEAPVELALDSFLPVRDTRLRFGAHGLRLPAGGGRIRLVTDHEQLSLDVWEGEPRGLDVDEWRAFSIAVSILGLRFAGDRRA
jgi:two-component system sensor histidine kinase KdpD